MELTSTRYGLSCITMLSRATKCWVALAATATGIKYSQNQIRNHFTAPVLHAKPPENDNSNDNDTWYGRLLSPKNERNKKPYFSTEYMTAELLGQEFSRHLNGNGGSVAWFETNHYNANDPIEDRHCECYLDPSGAYFFGVFDGHSGWQCSETLRLRLPSYISLGMCSDKNRRDFASKLLEEKEIVEYLGNPKDDCLTYKYPATLPAKQERIKTGIINFVKKAKDVVPNLSRGDILKYAYLCMDQDISKESIPDGKCDEVLWTGLSGAVAVGAYIEGKDLYIGNTGDCRAVLGTKSNAGTWLPIAMSEDHTCENMNEVNRLNKEHPGEEGSVILNGRLLGQLQPLRSFGDVVYKWSVELHRKVFDSLYGRPLVPVNIYKTPPYLTARPDISHKELDSDDRFLILACDGLWDTVENEKAVGIVGEYLDELEKGVKPTQNAATRLIRYALGNGSDHQLADMMQIPVKHRRNFHDDITVTVIFFNDEASIKSRL